MYEIYEVGKRVGYVTGRAKSLLQIQDMRPELLEAMRGNVEKAIDAWELVREREFEERAATAQRQWEERQTAIKTAAEGKRKKRAESARAPRLTPAMSAKIATTTMANLHEVVPFMNYHVRAPASASDEWWSC